MANLSNLLVSGASRLLSTLRVSGDTHIDGTLYLNGLIGSNTLAVYVNSSGVITAATGTLTNSISGNAATASAVKDYNNGSLTTFGYSTAGMSSTSWLGSWDGYKLRAISPANAIKSGVGTTAIGSTSLPIYWNGSSFVAITGSLGNSITGNAATASGVALTNTTTNADYRVLFSGTADDTTRSETTRKSTNLKYNPSTSSLQLVHINGSDTGEVKVTYSTTVSMWLGVGSGNVNHGLYDDKAGKWMIYADGSGNVTVNGNAATATKLASTGTTAQFWRGDNTWSNTISGGTLKVTNNSNTFTIGSLNSSFNHLYNSANIPFIFNNSVLTTTGNLGSTDYPFNNLYIGKTGEKGIYYVGTKATNRMITFVDNTSDSYGNGIKIGGGGVTVVGSGESSNISVTGGSEILYLLSDDTINIEANASTLANRIGFLVTTSGHLIPVKAEAANNLLQDIGTSSNRLRNIYANALDLSGDASNPSATAGARIIFSYTSGLPVYISYTPNDNYRAPAGLKVFGGASANPAWFETEGSFYATGTAAGTGYNLHNAGIEYARLWISAVGVASTTTTYTNPGNSSLTKTGYINGVTGYAYLSIGNSRVAGSNGSSYTSPGSATTANNAQGWLRLYSSGSGYADMTAYTSDKTRIYPVEGINLPENKVVINFRPGTSSYYTHVSYLTSGNEALVMATTLSVTSFIFINGETTGNVTSSRWQSLVPALLIKLNCVSIGKLIANNVTPTYKLHVEGTTNITGAVTMGSTLAVTSTSTFTGAATFNGAAKFNAHMNWKAGTNFYCDGVTANGQEWSFDLTSGSYTGTYWHVWSGKNSATILGCYNDDRHVTMPGNIASTSTSTGTLQVTGGIGATGLVTALRLAANGSNTSYSLYVNGNSYLVGETIHGANVRSDTTRTDYLGTSSYYWKGAYIWGDGAIHPASVYGVNPVGGATYVHSDTAKGPMWWLWRDLGDRGSRIWNMAGLNITIEYTTNSGSSWAVKSSLDTESKRSLTTSGNSGYGNIGNTLTANAGGSSGNYTLHPQRVAGRGVRITLDSRTTNGSAHYGWWSILRISLAGYMGTYTIKTESAYYNSSGTETWNIIDNTRTFCNNTSWDSTLYIHPETTYYWDGANNRTTGNNKRYMHKLRLTLICTAVLSPNTASSYNRYSGWISSIACYGGTSGSDVTTNTTYPLSSRYQWTMGRYDEPYYIYDYRLGRVQFSTDTVRIYDDLKYTAANTDSWATLLLGNGDKKDALNRHTEGQILMYSSMNGYHYIRETPGNTGGYTAYLAKATGWIAIGGNGSSTGVGSASLPVYMNSSGLLVAGNTIPSTGNFVLKSGDTMTGALTVKGWRGTVNVDYGETLPSRPSVGLIFFLYGPTIMHELPQGGPVGYVLVKNTTADYDVKWGTIFSPNTSIKYYVAGPSTTSATGVALFNTNVFVLNNVLYGAAWNDYAEYRERKGKYVSPGHCVIENGDGSLSQSTKRLLSGAEIVSDTFGFAIGKTNKCKLPIAVSGRVLAYPYEDINTYKIGAPVCSGPNGTVSLMTDEEARLYPWLIIGTVSSIPTEKTWGANNVKINGRIWIRVR